MMRPARQVDSAARLLQGAMRSFVFRRQTLAQRQSPSPPLPPRGVESGTSAPPADAALAAFAVADAAASRRGRAGGGVGDGMAAGCLRQSRQSSRKSVAGAVGGGWEASNAHAASTLADVFPPEDEDEGENASVTPGVTITTITAGSGSGRGAGVISGGAFFGSDGGGGGDSAATKGVSAVVKKFLEGPAMERFGGDNGSGGGGGLRKSSVGTLGGRRSTVSHATSGRRSSTSVRFVDGGRRSTVGGWGEGDEAARPGASVCKDCLSDIASLLAVAMAPAEAARTAMEVKITAQDRNVCFGEWCTR